MTAPIPQQRPEGAEDRARPPSAPLAATSARGADPALDAGTGAGRALDAGTATAEYAIATLAACGFAALLVSVLSSDQVRGMLLGIVQRALTLG